jgi:hypothetical protein
MSCSIQIQSVIGIPLVGGNPGSLSAIRVSGTASGLANGGNTLLVQCECFRGGQVNATVINGNWTVDGPVIQYTRNISACQCGQNDIVIYATDPNESSCGDVWPGTIGTPLDCLSCPVVQVTVSVGDCSGGSAPVTFNVTVTQPAGSNSAFQFDWGDGANGVPDFSGIFPATGPTSFSAQHNYTEGNFTPRLITGLPSGCPDVDVPVNIPDCICPPITQVTFSQGNCDGEGNRQVTATVSGGPANASITWQWDFESQAHSGGTSDAEILRGGTTHTVTVVMTAGNCQQQFPASVQVDACEGPPQCPSVTSLVATPASGSAPLTVNFVATVTNPASIVPVGGSLYQWQFGDGTSAGTGTPTATHTYTSASSCPGATCTATVTVNGPAGCQSSSASAQVSITSTSPPPPKQGCAVLLILAVIFILLGSILAVIGLCASIVWLEAVGAVLIGAGIVMFVIWAIFCAAFTACSVMISVDCLLRWMIVVVGPILTFIFAFFGTPACGLAAAVAWGGWATLQNILEAIMIHVDCEPRACV